MTTLAQMSELARGLLDANVAVEAAEEQLRQAKERARQLSEETIPAAMQELGLEEIKLDTGQKLSIKQDVYASIPLAQRAQAYGWLEEHGFGGLIKGEVVAAFGKGESEQALQLCAELQAKGVAAQFEQTVAPQTLKAFLREQLAAGTDLPLELFGARPVWTTKLKQ